MFLSCAICNVIESLLLRTTSYTVNNSLLTYVVRHAVQLLAARGWQVVNADLTLLAEAPRVAGQRELIRASVAGLLGVAAEAVNLKATTTERLGFAGRGEGLAAMATVLIESNSVAPR